MNDREKIDRLDRLINRSFILIFVGLCSLTIFQHLKMKNVESLSEERRSARMIIMNILRMDSLILDIDSSHQAYLLNQKREDLNQYQKFTYSLNKIWQETEQLIGVAGFHHSHLLEFKLIMKKNEENLTAALKILKENGKTAAIKFMQLEEHQNLRHQLRQIIDEIEMSQENILDRKAKESNIILSQSNTMIFASSFVTFFFILASLYFLKRNRQHRKKVEEEIHLAHQRLRKHAESLNQIINAQNSIATAELDSQKVIALIVHHAQSITQSEGTVIEMIDNDQLVYHSATGPAKAFLGTRIPIEGSLSGLCIQSDNFLLCEDSESDSRVNLDACRKMSVRSMILVPLKHQGKTIGVLKTYSSRPHHFYSEHGHSLQLISGLLAVALERSQSFEEKLKAINALEEMKKELITAKEAAENGSKIKSAFLANMSHEIRTPLNGILGISNILRNEPLTIQQKEYVDIIHRSGQSLLFLVNDILDFSKIEAGKIAIEELDFDLVSTIMDLIKSFQITAQKKKIELKYQISEQLPLYVKGDPYRLRQILNNLLSNALKFTHQGQVQLKVFPLQHSPHHSSQLASSAIHLRFEVKDTGIGIPPQVQEQLFQVFTQGDSSTSRKYGGTGLGLSISKRLVEKMGGEIGIESIEGKGSTFWFTIQFTPGNLQQVAIEGKNLEIDSLEKFDKSNFRILVAEDNQVNQLIVLKMLEKWGLHADAVANGKEVVKALGEISYDLILMDCQMPEIDGYEATGLIRRGEVPGNSSTEIPIIAMTANAMVGDKERCLEAGMNDYISKPLNKAALMILLTKWFQILKEPKPKSRNF